MPRERWRVASEEGVAANPKSAIQIPKSPWRGHRSARQSGSQLSADPSSQPAGPDPVDARILLNDPPPDFPGSHRQQPADVDGVVRLVVPQPLDEDLTADEPPDLGDIHGCIDTCAIGEWNRDIDFDGQIG